MSTFPKDRPGWPYRLIFTRSMTDIRTGDVVKRRKTIYFPRKDFSRKQVLQIKSELDHKFKTGEFDPWYDHVNVDRPDQLRLAPILASVIELYIDYKSKYDWRPGTAERYRPVLALFAREFAGRHVQDLTQQQVMDFINREELAYESRRTYRRIIITFLSWCKENDYHHDIDIAGLKIAHGEGMQEQTIRYLSAEEIKRLTSGIAGDIISKIRRGRNMTDDPFLIIDLITWQRMTGMRISETLSLKPSNINLGTWEVTIGDDKFVTKSRKRQTLPIGSIPRLQHIVRRRLRRMKGDTLFGIKDVKRQSRRFKAYVRQFLPDRQDIHLHDLRHTCAIELLRGGVGIYQVSRWMRHKNVTTTQRYADLLASDLARQVGSVFSD
jgi:integrase